MLLVVKKTTQESVSNFELLGFAAVHNFYHYPESTRLRISQVDLTALLPVDIFTWCIQYFVHFFEVIPWHCWLFFLLLHPWVIFFFSNAKLTLTEVHYQIFWKVKQVFGPARFLYDFVVFFRYLSCHLIRVKAMVFVFLKQSIISHSLRTYTM